MDIRELYSGLRRIQNRGETGNAYVGCGTVDEARDVLGNFFDYLVEKYEDSMLPWAEAFMQVFSWQFQTLHEGAETYYSNEYGDSDYVTITRVTAFLRENGQIEMVEFLYNNGTEFDVSEAAKNPLFGAIYGGHYNVVQFLVEHGIDITKSYPIGELDNVDGCVYAQQLGRHKIEQYWREKMI